MPADFTIAEYTEAVNYQTVRADTTIVERMLGGRGVNAIVLVGNDYDTLDVRVWPADADKVPEKWGRYTLLITTRTGSWD